MLKIYYCENQIVIDCWRVGFRITRAMTRIEIYPRATFGSAFFIGHGKGVVIVETDKAGARLTLYHWVSMAVQP